MESETTNNKNNANNEHPRTLQKHTLATFLRDEIGIREISLENFDHCIVARYFALPGVGNVPVKSYELLKYTDEEAPTDFMFGQWKIWCYQVPTVEIISLLNEIHFLFAYYPSNMLLGTDVLFWYHYMQLIREILLKDQYIPALKYRGFAQPHHSQIHHNERFQIYPAWEIVSERY